MKTLLASILVLPLLAQSQKPQAAPSAEPAKSAPEEGIPVTNQLVISKCGGCHTKDENGNMLRISWERATPEGWEEAIKRMVRLSGVSLTPDEARSIVKYLATYHGLAPEEAKPIMYYAEHRIQDETNIPNDNVHGACANCHAWRGRCRGGARRKIGKMLANLHIALYPQADEAFRLGINAGGFDEDRHHADPGAPLPVDEALAYLSKTAPLQTPEWAAWRARMRAPKLAGRWIVSAYIPGRGKFYGDMEVEASSGTDDEFTTRVKLTSIKDGTTISRTGHSLVYAGYAWRGRSKGTAAANAAPDDLASEMREVMWVSPDQSTAEGRWFWGQYQEFGFDVKLRRASADPTLIGADRYVAEDRHARDARPLDRGKLARADCARGSGLRNRSYGETHCLSHADRNRGGSGRGSGRRAGQTGHRFPPLGAAERHCGIRSHRLCQSDAGLGSGASGQRKASQGLSSSSRLSPTSAARTASRTPPTMSNSGPST